MKIYVILGIVLICIGCSINTDMIGKYSKSRNANSFQFKQDSTFIYQYRAYHLFQYSQGKWKRVNENMITLTSDIKSTAIPLSIKQVDVDNKENINIISIDLNIENSDCLSEYECGVYINEELYCIKRCDSVSFIPVNIPIKSIYFHFTKEPQISLTTAIAPPLFTSKYSPEATRGNKIKIEVDFKEAFFYYKSFNGDTIKVKANSIKMFNVYSRRWEKILKVSDEANIFSRFSDTLK